MFVWEIMDYKAKDLNNIPSAEDVAKPETSEPVIEAQEAINEEKDIPESALQHSIAQTADDGSHVFMEKTLSYPYSVYLGSFSTIKKVKKASAYYSEMGLSSYWTKVDLGKKGIWFRLFTGWFKTKKEADEFIKIRQIKDAESKQTKYTILIGIYTSEEEFDKQKNILEKLEYSPYFMSEANVYRLYVGAFDQKSKAEEQNSELANNGIPARLVER